MELSIIIVNWNTRDILLNCLTSVYDTIDADFEVWLVDNASTDGSVKAVRENFSSVNIIENTINLGFAAANNLAIKKAKGRYILLLNSDTVLHAGAVSGLLDFMERTLRAGVCGPMLLNKDGTTQNSIANTPTLATELLNKSFLRRIFPTKYPGKEYNPKEPIEVEGVIGAAMMIRREAIEEVGVMDKDYFFFLEETDWCERMRTKGWLVYFLPSAKVTHLQGASAGKVNQRARIEYWRSRYIFFSKHVGLLKCLLLKVGLFAELLFKFALILIPTILTLFLWKSVREKASLYARLLLWHIMGCPRGWGLKS
jgi:hypothetical protein